MRALYDRGKRVDRLRLFWLQSQVDLVLSPDCHLLAVTLENSDNCSHPIFPHVLSKDNNSSCLIIVTIK